MFKDRIREVKLQFSACEIHVILEIMVLELKVSHSKSSKENDIFPDWGLSLTAFRTLAPIARALILKSEPYRV